MTEPLKKASPGHHHSNPDHTKAHAADFIELPAWLQPLAVVKPDLSEAQRLLSLGFKLVRLAPYTKQPAGEGWNDPENAVQAIDSTATGYGLHLASNGLVSIDPDNWSHAVKGMAALDLDLEEIMSQGVRTRSTRPGSGGRSTFKAPGVALEWLKFSSKDDGFGTMLELRATSPNLQDVIPGLVYTDKSGVLRGQSYANDKRLSDAPELPQKLLNWWHKCSTDAEFENEQRKLFCAAVGCGANLRLSWNGPNGQIELAYKSPQHRQTFNEANKVEDILQRHGYTKHRDGRWSCPTASGKPGIRQIPGKDGLWKSDHASDPLSGTFDAWVACVVLDHDGDLKAAQDAQDKATREKTATMFSPVPGAAAPAGAGDRVRPKLLQHVADVVAELKPPQWLWSGIFEKGRVYALVGNPGAGKSTLAATLALACATGQTLAGRKTHGKRVLYLRGEDQHGTGLRFEMLQKKQGVNLRDLNLTVSNRSVDLEGNGIEELLSEAPGTFDVVIIDTVAAHSGADEENDNRAAHRLAMALHRLSEATGGACVVALSHPPKNAVREALLPRGGSAFTGAIDGVVCVWPANGSIELFSHAGKYRGRPFSGVTLRMEEVQHPTMIDSDGSPVYVAIATDQAQLPFTAVVISAETERTINEKTVLDHVLKLAQAGDFLSKTQARDLQLIRPDGKTVPNMKRLIGQLFADSKLIQHQVPKLLSGRGGVKDCLFPATSNPAALMLAKAERITNTTDDVLGLVDLMERLRKDAQGFQPFMHPIFQPVETHDPKT